MEATQTAFSLGAEIDNWQQNMLSGSLTPDDAMELTQHLDDNVADLKSKGLTDQEAWLVARHRMGNPAEIDTEFSKVNPDFAASRNLLMLFWGASIFMLLQSLFFVFPNVIWFIITNMLHGKPQHVLSAEQTRELLYVFCVLAMGLVILVLSKAGKVSAWFNQLITSYSGVISTMLIIFGSFFGTWNYKTISESMARDQNRWLLSNASDLLGIIFYGSVIFSTAWFTMRYRKQEFRSVKAFSNDINWVMSFGMGIVAELLVCVGNLFQSRLITYILIISLFAPAGWLIGQSKKYKLNLFMFHAFAFYALWGVAYYSAHQPLLMCATEYLLTVAVLITGCIIRRKNTFETQLT